MIFSIIIHIIVFAIFYGPFIVLFLVIYKVLAPKFGSSFKRIYLGIVFLLFIGVFYNDFYPSKRYYNRQCKSKTGIALPNDSRIVKKSSSSHIFTFGDELSSILIEVSEEDYHQILLQAKNLKKAPTSKEFKFMSTVIDDLSYNGNVNYYREVSESFIWDSGFDEYGLVFFEDENKILYYYFRW